MIDAIMTRSKLIAVGTSTGLVATGAVFYLAAGAMDMTGHAAFLRANITADEARR